MADRCNKELFVEKYFGLISEITNEETKIITDFGQLVNLLAMFEGVGRDGKTPDASENTLPIQNVVGSACLHPMQSRVRTHRGYYCGDCGKRF